MEKESYQNQPHAPENGDIRRWCGDNRPGKQGDSCRLKSRDPVFHSIPLAYMISIFTASVHTLPPCLLRPGATAGELPCPAACGLRRVDCQKALAGVPAPFPTRRAPGWCEVRKRLGFTGCSQLASTRAALSSPPPAAFRPAVTHTAILAGAPSPGPTSFPLPCRRVLSRSQRLAACRARYLWGTSTGGGVWYSGPWPVFPAFPGVREVIIFRLKMYGKKNIFKIN